MMSAESESTYSDELRKYDDEIPPPLGQVKSLEKYIRWVGGGGERGRSKTMGGGSKWGWGKGAESRGVCPDGYGVQMGIDRLSRWVEAVQMGRGTGGGGGV